MRIGMSFSRTEKAKCYSRYGENAYKKLKEHGYSCVDFNMGNPDHLVYTGEWDEIETYLLKEKALADEAGIVISQTHGPWRWPPQDHIPSALAEWLEMMKKAVRATAVLGCKYCVVHPVMPALFDDGKPEAEDTWKTNVTFMRELLETARAVGVTVCLENMPLLWFSISKPQAIARLVREIDNEHFKMCFDTGHVFVFEGMSPAEELRKVGDIVKVLHIHDNDRERDSHKLPFCGSIDWADFGKALKDIDFTGVFSLETCPSAKLPDDIFEDMSKALAKMAKFIVEAKE